MNVFTWFVVGCETLFLLIHHSPKSLLNLPGVRCAHLAALHGHAPARFDAPSLRQHLSLRRPSARRLLSAQQVRSHLSAALLALRPCNQHVKRHLCWNSPSFFKKKKKDFIFPFKCFFLQWFAFCCCFFFTVWQFVSINYGMFDCFFQKCFS